MSPLTAILSLLLASESCPDSAKTAETPRASGVVLYVDDNVGIGGDGTSWQTAFRYLQDALMLASNPQNGVSEIRIAQGIYKPDQGAGYTPGNRNHSFVIASGLSLRGGFAGLTGDDPDKQDWGKFESILSGDLLGNDGPPGTFQNYNDNSIHVARIVNAAGITLEGITIASGAALPFADELSGGGLWATNSFITITDSVFRDGLSYYGAGASLHSCTATIARTRFSLNKGRAGGGLEFRSSHVSISNCLFENNWGDRVGGGGVLMYTSFGSPPPSTCVIELCAFRNNSGLPGSGYGGAVRGGVGTMTIRQCSFEDNIADIGGAIYGSPEVEDSSFTGNYSTRGGAILGGGIYRRCLFIDNEADIDGGARFSFGIGDMIDCEFVNNVAYWDGGGGSRGGGKLINCRFRNNVSWANVGGGGALHITYDAEVVNCEMNDNYSQTNAGAVRVLPNIPVIISNSTIAMNTSHPSVGAMSAAGPTTLVNSIVWGNVGGNISGNIAATYSCIQGGWLGDGNIVADPKFVAAARGDFRLTKQSPCIDAGNNTALPSDSLDIDGDGNTHEVLPIDLDGAKRAVNVRTTPNTGHPPGPAHAPIVDMGAYEHPPRLIHADINGDGWVSVTDLLIVISSWGPCPDPAHCPADIAPSTPDGVVNQFDLLEVISHWG